MVSARSALSESRYGLPLSSDSRAASSSLFCSIRSASLLSSRPRSEAFILRHGPSSNAFRAALTARSMSALSPSATWQMVSPVAGLSVGKVLPETLSSHLPPMSSGWSFTLGGLTAALRDLVAVAVAMRTSSTGNRANRGKRVVARDCPAGRRDCQGGARLSDPHFRLAEKKEAVPAASLGLYK